MMIKYKQVLVNQVEFKLAGFEEFDSPVTALENKMIRQLTIDLETKS